MQKNSENNKQNTLNSNLDSKTPLLGFAEQIEVVKPLRKASKTRASSNIEKKLKKHAEQLIVNKDAEQTNNSSNSNSEQTNKTFFNYVQQGLSFDTIVSQVIEDAEQVKQPLNKKLKKSLKKQTKVQLKKEFLKLIQQLPVFLQHQVIMRLRLGPVFKKRYKTKKRMQELRQKKLAIQSGITLQEYAARWSLTSLRFAYDLRSKQIDTAAFEKNNLRKRKIVIDIYNPWSVKNKVRRWIHQYMLESFLGYYRPSFPSLFVAKLIRSSKYSRRLLTESQIGALFINLLVKDLMLLLDQRALQQFWHEAGGDKKKFKSFLWVVAFTGFYNFLVEFGANVKISKGLPLYGTPLVSDHIINALQKINNPKHNYTNCNVTLRSICKYLNREINAIALAHLSVPAHYRKLLRKFALYMGENALELTDVEKALCFDFNTQNLWIAKNFPKVFHLLNLDLQTLTTKQLGNAEQLVLDKKHSNSSICLRFATQIAEQANAEHSPIYDLRSKSSMEQVYWDGSLFEL